MGPPERYLFEKVDFLAEVLFDEFYLQNASGVRVKLIHDVLDFFVLEFSERQRLIYVKEVLLYALTSHEVRRLELLGLPRLLLKEVDVESVLADVVRELLDRSFGPLLDALEVLALVSVVEVLNRLFKFNLSRAKRVNLHELLQVEEGLRH